MCDCKNVANECNLRLGCRLKARIDDEKEHARECREMDEHRDDDCPHCGAYCAGKAQPCTHQENLRTAHQTHDSDH